MDLTFEIRERISVEIFLKFHCILYSLFFFLSQKTSSWKGGSPNWSELKTLSPREDSGWALNWGKMWWCTRWACGELRHPLLLFPLSTLLPSSFPSFSTSFPSRAFFSSFPLLEFSVPKMRFWRIHFSRFKKGHVHQYENLSWEGQNCKKAQLIWEMEGEQLCDCLSARPKRSRAFALLPPLHLALL